MKLKTILLCSLLLCSVLTQAQKQYPADWASLDTRPVPEWYTNAKFGIFIHWGVYAVPSWAPVGPEYSTYSKYAEWYWNRMMTDTTNVGDAFRKHHLDTYGKDFKYQDF